MHSGVERRVRVERRVNMTRTWNFQGTEGEKTTTHNMAGGSRQGGQR